MSVVLFLLVTLLNPHDRFTWVLEVFWVVIGLCLLLWLNSRKIIPTHLLSICLVAHAFILIYGGWYTYELVPLGDWFSDNLNWERNHYDRLGHFAQGFFPAVLFREVLYRNRVVNGMVWLEFIMFGFVMAFTSIFEIIEFGAAMAFADGADAYLGSQGDIWDAQWDMVMCGIGGVISILVLSKIHISQMKNNITDR